ncbi:thiamine pyrophosphate-binding protein [Actinokineospora auranticolor]|uniref:Benzoylformate decarboxylase n=1 Tax=Actinokineospora auranticolor TaxID=155976 RepID=A0A2S6GIY2_9PSEU|nr:thiamine pyrophosphate-binding protein [Actinokineospora auranticolor]PPK65198.1 benzoylformate decarboxylase [Actinokineospora auranticolor]
MKPIEALLAVLREERVTKVFGNPGTSELPFLDALVDTPDIEYVMGVHECAVVAMADGYARATGRPAFISLHIAAGLANGLIGLLNAGRSRTPLVVTAGQQDRRHLIQDPMLSGDLIGLARAAVKQTFDVQHAHDLPLLLRRAFAAAVAPPAGPVLLSIPMDLLAEDVDVDLPTRTTFAPLGAAGGVAEAARMLLDAANPAIVAGDGVGREGATAELIAVAEALGATVFHQPMHDAVDFPYAHPLHAGPLPPVNAAVNKALTGHDVVFIAGAHAFNPHHYTPVSPIPESTAVIQLDSDHAEPGRNFGVALGLVGGIKATLGLLADAIGGPAPRAAERVEASAARHRTRVAEHDAAARAVYGPAPFDPFAAVHAIVAGLPEDVVVIDEAITSGVLFRKVMSFDRPGGLVHTVGGGLGWGVGAAIGTAMGTDRPVVALLGDGCTMFGLQGLWSAAREQAPVTFLVMNNGEYRTLKDTLDSWHSRATVTGNYPGLDLTPSRLDFTKAAEFFGVPSVRPTDLAHLTEIVAKSTQSAGPLLVDIPITGHPSHA